MKTRFINIIFIILKIKFNLSVNKIFFFLYQINEIDFKNN